MPIRHTLFVAPARLPRPGACFPIPLNLAANVAVSEPRCRSIHQTHMLVVGGNHGQRHAAFCDLVGKLSGVTVSVRNQLPRLTGLPARFWHDDASDRVNLAISKVDVAGMRGGRHLDGGKRATARKGAIKEARSVMQLLGVAWSIGVFIGAETVDLKAHIANFNPTDDPARLLIVRR